MIKIFLLSFLLFPNAHAWIDPNILDSTYLNLEENLLKRTLRGKFTNASSALEEETVNFILNDSKNLISDDFKISPYFQASVRFWFSIYTQFSSKQVVIHDMDELDIVYNIIDFSEIHSSEINKYAKAKLQTELSLEYTRKLKTILKKLSKTTKDLNAEEKGVLAAIEKVRKIPENNKKKAFLFKKLAQNIRTQTGQRDMIYRGMLRAIPYLDYLNDTIDEFKLPRELLAITFLESSFNPHAYSKVGAAGAWQFMPYIANLFMPKISKSTDYRLNPMIASIAAFHLLKQNKMIVKSWDLAVTAYNSGTKHIVKARRKFGKKEKLNLEFLLQNYNHAHLGFASKNFYSEFLALVHTLAYKDVIYPLQGFHSNKLRFKTENVEIYITKCSFNPDKVLNALRKSSPNLKELNSHFLTKKKTLGAGELFVSDINLTSKKYLKISQENILKHYPKKWPSLYGKLKCN